MTEVLHDDVLDVVVVVAMVCDRFELSFVINTWYFWNNSSKGVWFLLNYEKVSVMGFDKR